MGGFFGTISRKECKYDVFFGTDYHSHLGTRRGGLAFYDEAKGFQPGQPVGHRRVDQRIIGVDPRKRPGIKANTAVHILSCTQPPGDRPAPSGRTDGLPGWECRKR